MKKLNLFIIFLVISVIAVAQPSRTIKGIVLDEDQSPVIGASVLLKGTTIGTITDIEGRFSLTFREVEQAILVVSYIGYITKEVPIDSHSDYRIIMRDDNNTLDEVVVMSTGRVRKSVSGALTGRLAGTAVPASGADKKKLATTWKRSGMKDNSIRLQVGEKDFLPLKAAQMAIRIDGFRVRVLMDCFFYNDKGSGLEGTFKLKLPTEATPYYFAFGETEYLNVKYTLDNFDMTYQGIYTVIA